jgi:enterochelin esterase-like enzyme
VTRQRRRFILGAVVALAALVAGACTATLASASTVQSAALGRDMPIDAYSSPHVADCANAPILVLFHGRGGDEHQWMGGSLFSPGVGVDQIADALVHSRQIPPLTIVSASINDSYGVDSAPANDGYTHGPYERYIVDELLPVVSARYDVGGTRPLYVGGLSMGGYAALNVALDDPGKFHGVGALSPALYVSPPAERAWMYTADGRTSLFARADAGAADSLRIFLGVGTNDYPWIAQATTAFDKQLTGRGVDVTMKTIPGGHEVPMWHALAEPMLLSLFGDLASCA